MERIKRQSLFLVVIALLLAALSAALIFTAAPKRAAKADEEKIVSIVEKIEDEKEINAERIEKKQQILEMLDLHKELRENSISIKSSSLEVPNYLEFVKITESDGIFHGRILALESGNNVLYVNWTDGLITVNFEMQNILDCGYLYVDQSYVVELPKLTNEERSMFMSEEDYLALTDAVYIPSSFIVGSRVIDLGELDLLDYATMPFSDTDVWPQFAVYAFNNVSTPTEPEPPDNPSEPTEPTVSTKPITHQLSVSSDSVSDNVVEITSVVGLCAVVGVLLCIAIMLFKKK